MASTQPQPVEPPVDLFVAYEPGHKVAAFKLAADARRAGHERKTRTRGAQREGPAQAGLAHPAPLRCHLRRRRRPAARPRRRRGQGRRPRIRHAPHQGTTLRPPRANPYRDAWAGELDAARVGEHVRVAGWVHRRRDHGGVIFIDLRDRSGIVQLVVPPGDRRRGVRAGRAAAAGARRSAPPARSSGATRATSTRTSRRARSSSRSTDAEHLAESLTPPFPIDEDGQVDEMIRLRNRMLDLRRESMQRSDDPAPHGQPGDPRLPQRERLPGDRDADPDALDARGRARLPGAGAADARARSTRCRSRRSCSSSC